MKQVIMILIFVAVPNFQVVDENAVRYDHTTDDPKYFIVKAEWFWTRIAEGYAPEDDFLYKDVRMTMSFLFIEKTNDRVFPVHAKC